MLIGVVYLHPLGRVDVALEYRVFGLPHPSLQALFQLRERRPVRRVGGEVMGLVGVEDDVIELLARDLALAPSIAQQEVLGGAIVGVGQHGRASVPPTADVLVAGGTNRALRLIGGVSGRFAATWE